MSGSFRGGRGRGSRGRGGRPRQDRYQSEDKLTADYIRVTIPAIAPAPDRVLTELQLLLDPLPGDAAFFKIDQDVAAAKRELDAIPAAEYARWAAPLDLYAGLKTSLSKDYRMLITTNATIKMVELIYRERLIPRDRPLRLFANAELPGAFVVAVNHYVRSVAPEVDFDWVASSYWPAAAQAAGDVTILGDRYGLFAGSPDRWLMGRTVEVPGAEAPAALTITGDLTQVAQVLALAYQVRQRFKGSVPELDGCTLYTSDAGIDVSGDYNSQEAQTALLNYGQIVCGLLSLAPGGHLVTKQFTFNSRFSREVIALAASLFDEFAVVKPVTSRPGNSEVYLVGKGFRGCAPGLTRSLLQRLASADTTSPLLPAELLPTADAALLRAAMRIHGQQQVRFLQEMVAFYRQGDLQALTHRLRPIARQLQERWLCDYPLRAIPDDAQLATTPISHS